MRRMSSSEKLDVWSATCLIGFAGEASRSVLGTSEAGGGGDVEPTGCLYRATICGCGQCCERVVTVG
jgi:hypothetical protein